VNPVIAALLAAQPANTQALQLLDELLTTPPSPSDWLARADEVERAYNAMEHLAAKSRGVTERCLGLKPHPSPKSPPGF
jgi:hypothetical protein